jgi:hypothetical protein
MRFQLRRAGSLVPKRAFNFKHQIAAARMLIDKLRAFNSESRNDDRTRPTFPAFVRQIDDETQILAGNLRYSLPAAGRAFGRVAKRGAGQQNRGE